MCFSCGTTWHEGISCASALDREYLSYIERANVKYCPNCKVKIEKSEGCDHMTCFICKYQFCWLCLRKYTTHHFAEWNCCGCPDLLQNRTIFKTCLRAMSTFFKALSKFIVDFLKYFGIFLLIILVAVIFIGFSLIGAVLFGWLILYANFQPLEEKVLPTFFVCLFLYPLVIIYSFVFLITLPLHLSFERADK